MNKNSSGYGPSEQEKFFLSHGPAGSSNSGSSSSGGLRPISGGLLAPISMTGVSHPSGIPIQQSNHGKSGSITSGHPLRPPPSTASYHATVSVPRLIFVFIFPPILIFA